MPANIDLRPVKGDNTELFYDLIERNRTSPSIRRDFAEMLDTYDSLEATEERIATLYDSDTPTRHGYLAVDTTDKHKIKPVGLGYLALGELNIIHRDGSTLQMPGMNFSAWVNGRHRRRGIGRALVNQLMQDVPSLRAAHTTWSEAFVWTGIRPDNYESRALVASMGMVIVGSRIEAPEYDVYLGT